jgi:hypothetical protein
MPQCCDRRDRSAVQQVSFVVQEMNVDSNMPHLINHQIHATSVTPSKKVEKTRREQRAALFDLRRDTALLDLPLHSASTLSPTASPSTPLPHLIYSSSRSNRHEHKSARLVGRNKTKTRRGGTKEVDSPRCFVRRRGHRTDLCIETQETFIRSI